LKIDNSRLEISVDLGNFVFQIKKDKQKIFLLSDYIDQVKIDKNIKTPIILGVHQDSNKCFVDDVNEIGHSIYVGKSRSGKSSTLNMAIQSMMYLMGGSNIKFIMFDYKETELEQYKDFDNVTYLPKDENILIKTLEALNKEVENRYKKIREAGFKDVNKYNEKHTKKIPTIIMVIDEAAEIQFSPLAETINNLIASMINRMGAANVWLYLSLQKHTGNQIDTRIRSQFKTELLHRFDNKDKSGLKIEVPVFKLKKGEFYLNSEEYDYTKMKGLLIDDNNNKIYEILKEKYSMVGEKKC
jgi:S-DNA-T family DNA segregation ATPase FtsK/SpoIIIE